MNKKRFLPLMAAIVTCLRIVKLYFDSCDNCLKPFKTRHYTWVLCLKCHWEALKNLEPEDLEEYQMRIQNKEELE